MTSNRDGHVRLLPLHVANKIAAGEVVERPASVVKELVENAIDAGARKVSVTITQGGRKLVSVQDDGCGMTREDALLCLERQATSKILDVDDIERIDTLGFRGEAIPSIASVSRFTLTTRRTDSDEGTEVQVNAGTLAGVQAAGCPPGTRVEVRDLFCNVPARRKFLRAYATEEAHVKQIFTVHALAHPSVGFSLTVDGRELYRLAPTDTLTDRVRDLLGADFLEACLPVAFETQSQAMGIKISGFIERPNLATPTRRDQYVFVNGRPATSSSIAYAMREAYPRRAGDSRPAAIIFIDLPPSQVDVNVHPTKREVRFRDNVSVKRAIEDAIGAALCSPATIMDTKREERPAPAEQVAAPEANPPPFTTPYVTKPTLPASPPKPVPAPIPEPAPIETEFVISDDGVGSKPWKWFKFLAQSASGYLLIETDAGIVTVNPHAALERIAYEKLLSASRANTGISQTLLIPETVHLTPIESARIKAALSTIESIGFQIEEFGHDTFKIDALPQLVGSASPSALLASIASDLAENGARRGGDKWREELIAKSVASSFAGSSPVLNEAGAVKMIEDLCRCKMPYVCPRGKPVMIFTSTRELNRKFDRS